MGRIREAYRRYQVCGETSAATALLENVVWLKSVAYINLSWLLTTSILPNIHRKDIPRIVAIGNPILSQLATKNRKFIYILAKAGARAREYEDGLVMTLTRRDDLPDILFFKARVAVECLRWFVRLQNICLLRVMAQLPIEVLWTENSLYTEYKGAMAENMGQQSITANFEVIPRYWTSEADFLLQYGTDLSGRSEVRQPLRGGKPWSLHWQILAWTCPALLHE